VFIEKTLYFDGEKTNNFYLRKKIGNSLVSTCNHKKKFIVNNDIQMVSGFKVGHTLNVAHQNIKYINS
jgi:hypothetical protein